MEFNFWTFITAMVVSFFTMLTVNTIACCIASKKEKQYFYKVLDRESGTMIDVPKDAWDKMEVVAREHIKLRKFYEDNTGDKSDTLY